MQKAYGLHLLAMLLLNLYTLLVPLTFNKMEKTKRENVIFVHLSFFLFLFFLLIPLLSSSLASKARKLYGLYANIIHTKTTTLLLDTLIHWFGATYVLRLASYGQETVSQYARRSCSSTSVASVYILKVWHV